jgi:hypothetical protein
MIPPKDKIPPVVEPQGTDEEMLNDLQRETFDYFLKEVDKRTGLIADKTEPGFPSSIAVIGMGLSAYIVGVERKLLSRKEAIRRVLKILRFFYQGPQGTDPEAMGYKGFYYHFLEMNSGKRSWKCELSTVDTAFFIAGALSAATYFTGDEKDEKEIRQLSDELYRRIDWEWALQDGKTLVHGWKPESGFLLCRWEDKYSEAILLYVLAMGSPTHPIEPEGYIKWLSTFELKKIYDIEYLYAGPLFIHQFSHLWLDFRGIQDEFNRKSGYDYFENSRRATYVHRQYAIENPLQFKHYGNYCWGLTASDGPGIHSLEIDGRTRVFFDYIARGAPFGPDDGTISPWAVVASLPFAPEIVIDTIRHAIEHLKLKNRRLYGFDASFNPTYPEKNGNPNGWVSPWRFGINQGPIVIMIENYKSALIWDLMKKSSYLREGLKKAGFSGGWLDHPC